MNDLKFALRMIATRPWFSAVIIVILALGIGMNTMVFTIVNATLFKSIPVPNGVDLVKVGGQNIQRGNRQTRVSYPDFLELRSQNNSFEALEATWETRAIISENDNPPDRFRMARVTTGLFKMIRTPPAVGRDFTAEDGDPGVGPVMIIGHGLWKSRYAGDPNVVGKAVSVNSEPATIVGVMPEGLKFPSEIDCWMPLVPGTFPDEREQRRLDVFGTIKKETSFDSARADIAVIGRRLSDEFPDTNQGIGLTVRTLRESVEVESELRAVFLIMLAAVGFVLLIACSNVANMMLSRAVGRRFEMSVRSAIGATRWQLIRQLLTESLLLSVFGGLLGLAISIYGVRMIEVAAAGKLPHWMQFSMDYVAFAYFAAISIFSGILFGLAPAIRSSRVDLSSALNGTRTSGAARQGRLSGGLVVGQFAMTLVLLTGAGLMMRNFLAAQSINDFVPGDEILTAKINLSEGGGNRYSTREDRVQFYQEAVNRLKALPGVTHAAAGSSIPGIEDNETRSIEIEGQPVDDPSYADKAIFNIQTPEFLSLIELPVLEGRNLLDTDGNGGESVAVVTKRFAERYWPEQSAIGKRFRYFSGADRGPWINVVGVSADITGNASGSYTRPLVFTPYKEDARGAMFLLLRSSADPNSYARTIRTIVQDMDPDLALYNVNVLQQTKERNNSEHVIVGTLFATFAVIALLMASAGIYAIVAQATGNRTKEIGIRMAFGATPTKVYGLVLSRGVKQLMAGLAIGLAFALATTRLLEGNLLLTNVSSRDPVVFVTAVVLLVMIGLFACWLPARRAAKIDPMEALRNE